MKQYKIKIDGRLFDVRIDSVGENGTASVTVNGVAKNVELDSACLAASKAKAPAAVAVKAPVGYPSDAAAQSSAVALSTDKAVVSPLPGVILSIKVNVGDKVSAGECVATLEAMKMENDIESEVSGTVRAIHVQKGDSVLEGAKIVTIG